MEKKSLIIKIVVLVLALVLALLSGIEFWQLRHYKETIVASEVLKSRDIILPTKVRLVKPMVFPVVMYGCFSFSIIPSKEIPG